MQLKPEIEGASCAKLVKIVRGLVTAIGELERGCDCDYDYRCGRCSQVIRAVKMAEDLRAQ